MAEPAPLKIGITCYPSVGGSGILATTFAAGSATVGNITVETPRGDILARAGGVVQAVLVNAADGVRAGQTVVRLHSPALMGAQREYLQLRLQAEQAAGLRCGRTEDAAEALRAAVEKRLPNFIGR